MRFEKHCRAAHTLKLTVPPAVSETVSGSEVINGARQSYTVVGFFFL